MLAQQANAPFDSSQHLFELKWDGIRCLAFVENRQVRLRSRRCLDLTCQFPELACMARLPSGTVLDGELVVLNQGKPSLRHIQRRALLQNRNAIQSQMRSCPVAYMVFDLVYLSGDELLAKGLAQRRAVLEELLRKLPIPGVLVTEGVREDGRTLFAQVERMRLEGIMAKRLDSPYLPGKRSCHWLKIKAKPIASNRSNPSVNVADYELQ